MQLQITAKFSQRSRGPAFLKKMSSPPISEDGNPFDTGQRDRCTLRNRGGAAAEVASPCAFVYNIIYQYYISVLYQYRKCIRIHSGTVSGTAGDAVGLCSQRMAGDAPCKHFYTRLCCATLHTSRTSGARAPTSRLRDYVDYLTHEILER